MKFILRYDGPLHAEQDSREDRLRRAKEKWDIRRQLHPQLTELWATSAALERARQYAIIPKEGGYMRWEEHHSARIIGPIIPANHRYLFEPVDRAGLKFNPLVRESMALTCHLDVLFLRKGMPGDLIRSESGDVDNRLKVLFDGLQMPADNASGAEDTDPNPFNCLLEDDRLIESFSIKTANLLDRGSNDPSTVSLVIEVTVKASMPASYNLPLLGG